MNKKGQALVEFVLILPLFIMILFVIIDFGMIFNTKSELENISSDVIERIKNKESINEIRNSYDNISIELLDMQNNTKITIKKDVDVVTPGLNLIIGDPYEVIIERLNNKGQSLVMFIFVLPILLLVLVLVIDMGRLITIRQELDNVNKMVIEYVLDKNISDNEAVNLINANISNLKEISINNNQDEVTITLKKKEKGILGKFFKFYQQEINSSYRGDKISKKIERVK